MERVETPPAIFDRALVALRRERAAATVAKVAPVLDAAAMALLDRLDDTTRRFSRALDLGGRGPVAPALRARGIPFVVSMDLAPAMARRAQGLDTGGLAVAADEEWLPFAPGSFDLIVASLSLHWVNDLPGALIQIRQALSPDGLFLASLPGLGTLQGLREALNAAEAETRGGVSPRISPFPELRDLAGLLQRAGFAIPVADQERLPMIYRSPMGLVADLRAAGESNAVRARDSRVPPRAFFPLAFSRLNLDMELRLLVMTGWSPHESQQKPARPGSANARLAEALGSVEIKAGEKPG
ncbi:methyltransferase domain-containing protein [Roseococcus sp. SYP-B2431]|uniref:methyltransferase domain-containing protein n=1 Tax=Roseococcus sp. SYP-B2431 TaxID=2496640 RepID=UPI00103B9585|nr:methyltransferase domain-containing protein [Roseococcus sp. SYP-B2431]TCH98568.1 methyltransferase domain-containing protein [Roseococcus sp. SYP-B2431]